MVPGQVPSAAQTVLETLSQFSIHPYRSLAGFQRKKRLNQLASSVVVIVLGERRAFY